MTPEEAVEYIHAYGAERYLQRDGSGKGWICPICGSGSGPKGTGITSKDGIHFTCWKGSGCFRNADIIDIIGLEQGIDDYPGKLRAAADIMGISIDEHYKGAGKVAKKSEVAAQKQPSQTAAAPVTADYVEFYKDAAKRIGETDYHRGISEETLKRFMIGYVSNYQGDNRRARGWDALIIPTGKNSYILRNTDSSSKDRYCNQGAVMLFNTRALETATQPIIVVEGAMDAMSIADCGGEAVALCSTANWKKLLDLLRETPPVQPLILALDNDSAGDGCLESLQAGLDELGISYICRNVSAPYKDANEALMADRASFEAAVQDAESTDIVALKALEDEQRREQERRDLVRESAAFSLQSFLSDIKASKEAACVSTGFKSLDKVLEGGLYAGLYVVGAISSLGKTTFCLQVADQIARQGHDVLIFSLEMARNELIAKSVSRQSLILDLEQNKSTAHAKTTRGILTGSRYDGYSREETGLIEASVRSYSSYASRIYITEGIGNVGVQEIREKVEKHIQVMGKPPVVLIDYLQILAPADIRATDKQNTDKAVLELKRLSRDCKIPVIGISSFNRDNYTSPVNLTSFKESGAIEYSSDVLIGLQHYGMDYQEGEKANDRDSRIRELVKKTLSDAKNGNALKIQLKVLKNRNGGKGEALFDFYPMFNYFREAEVGQEDEDGWTEVPRRRSR